MTRLCTLALLVSACGARTGLEIDEREASREIDGGVDAHRPDAGTMCVPGLVTLDPSPVDVVFVVDRSGSMNHDFEGDPPAAGEPSRWEVLATAMNDALGVFEGADRINQGAEFFPAPSAADLCAVSPGLDVPIGPNQIDAILTELGTWAPAGGTPLNAALAEAMNALELSSTGARFIVLMTDGEPTCLRDPVPDLLQLIREGHGWFGIDVFVVGIASNEWQQMLLDEMAIGGGRPRPPSEAHRFYDARDPDLLRMLLSSITTDLALCVFAVPFPPGPADEIEVSVGDEIVARDEERIEGWDWTNAFRRELSLFGRACERAIAGASVRADITCH